MKKSLALSLVFMILLSIVFCSCDLSSKEQGEETFAPKEEHETEEGPSEELADPRHVSYSKAIKCLSDGEIESAYDLFLTIKDYRDVSKYLERFSFHYATKVIYSPHSIYANYFEYDEYGNSTLKVYGGDEQYVYEYDKNQNLIRETRCFGFNKYVSVYEYDEQGRPVGREDEDTGYFVTLEYDAAGNRVKTTYPSSMVEMRYDEDGRLVETQVKNLDGTVTGNTLQEYDEQGNCVKYIQNYASGSTVTSFLFDAKGNVLKRTVEQSNGYSYTDEYQYDDRGNQIYHKYFYSEARFSIDRWKYDQKNNLIQESRETQNGVEYVRDFEYDAQGNCIKETHTVPRSFTSISYHEYDSYGNLIKTIAPGETDSPDDYWITVYSGYRLYYNPYGVKEALPVDLMGK